jgi:RNA polymerase sigma-70 factor (ECF subfamily)
MTGASNDILETLVEQARAGDRQAFSEIVRRLMSQVTALTYKMTGDRDTALDLAQDSFISAWEKLRTYRGEASFTGWLYRIATNKTLNYLKSASRQTTMNELPEQADSTDQASPERTIHRKELAEQVWQFMATLPPQQRVIFELRFYKEMSFAEIAEATDRALGTVKTGYREAVKKLRVFARDKGWHS